MDASSPHLDIHSLFQHYSYVYFEDDLGACSVEWSSARMTLCASAAALWVHEHAVVL